MDFKKKIFNVRFVQIVVYSFKSSEIGTFKTNLETLKIVNEKKNLYKNVRILIFYFYFLF